jgi:hypothetical protein
MIGSGYVLSKGLMDATFGYHADHVNHVMDDFQAFACCGDEILARALYSTPDVYIKAPSPISHQLFSGETPTSERYRERNWCEPIVTFHHVKPDEIAALHAFEQQLFRRLLRTDLIRHLDVFAAFQPDFMRQAYDNGDLHVLSGDWENRAEDEEVPAVEGMAFDATFCEAACRERPHCWLWQFRHNEEGERCTLGTELVRIGGQRTGFTSGWMLGRLRAMRATQPCEDRRFLS